MTVQNSTDEHQDMVSTQQDAHPLVVYTIGYGRLIPSDLIRLLVVNRINVVVDVRSIPYSKYSPQFNKRSLEQNLTDCGFEYRFGGKYLGAYPDGRKPPPGMIPDWKALSVRKEFKHGIRRIEELAQQHRVGLLCAEEKPYRCHRHHLIAVTLIKMGIRVIHLRHDGRKQQALMGQKELF